MSPGNPSRQRLLAWLPGPRDSDGIWAPQWYESVWNSTGFEPPQRRDIHLEGEGARVAEACPPLYEKLHGHR